MICAALVKPDVSDSSMLQRGAVVATSAGSEEAVTHVQTPEKTEALRLPFDCSFDPVPCSRWCQQPPWNHQDGAGPPICCSGSGGGNSNSFRELLDYRRHANSSD